MPTAPRLLVRVAHIAVHIAPQAALAAVLAAALAPANVLAAPATTPTTTAPGSAPTAAPTAPPVQRPGASAPTTPATRAAPAPTPTGAQPAPAPNPTTSPAPTPGAAPLVPAAPTGEPAAGDPAADPAAAPPATTPAEPAELPSPTDPAEPPSPAAPGLAEQLLGPSVNQHPSERPAGRVRSEEESAEAEDAAIAAMYRNLYRPANNPGRFNIVVRGAYMLAGSVDNTLSGRLGGLSADLGQSFNKFGYAVTLVAQFGNILHTKPDRETQTIALVGGGPTLSLGRLALLQRGFLDARVGYDFFAGPTRQIVDGMAIADGIRAPHGPRLSLNMGLLNNPGRARKLIHGFGLTIGYQALVHSLKGEFPVTNVLQFGIVYWGG